MNNANNVKEVGSTLVKEVGSTLVKVPQGFTVIEHKTINKSNTAIAILRSELNAAYDHKQGIPVLQQKIIDRCKTVNPKVTEACLIDTYIPRLVASKAIVQLQKGDQLYILPLRLTTNTDHILPATKQIIEAKVVQDAITAVGDQFATDQKVKTDNAKLITKQKA